jgi:hypothetical protein
MVIFVVEFSLKKNSTMMHELIYIFDGIPKFLVVLESYMLEYTDLFILIFVINCT